MPIIYFSLSRVYSVRFIQRKLPKWIFSVTHLKLKTHLLCWTKNTATADSQGQALHSPVCYARLWFAESGSFSSPWLLWLAEQGWGQGWGYGEVRGQNFSRQLQASSRLCVWRSVWESLSLSLSRMPPVWGSWAHPSSSTDKKRKEGRKKESMWPPGRAFRSLSAQGACHPTGVFLISKPPWKNLVTKMKMILWWILWKKRETST